MHDVKELESVLNTIVVKRPERKGEAQENLCLDAGYFGKAALEVIARHGCIAHVVSRGEEKKELEKKTGYKARRWVVERFHSWLNRFRKLLVRYEKEAWNFLGLIELACAFICYRQVNII